MFPCHERTCGTNFLLFKYFCPNRVFLTLMSNGFQSLASDKVKQTNYFIIVTSIAPKPNTVENGFFVHLFTLPRRQKKRWTKNMIIFIIELNNLCQDLRIQKPIPTVP